VVKVVPSVRYQGPPWLDKNLSAAEHVCACVHASALVLACVCVCVFTQSLRLACDVLQILQIKSHRSRTPCRQANNVQVKLGDVQLMMTFAAHFRYIE